MSEFVNTVDVIGDDVLTDQIICRNVEEYMDDQVEEIGNFAFYNCLLLESVDLPAASMIGDNAFYGCNGLITANCPSALQIGVSAFSNCKKLTTINAPKATKLNKSAFALCSSILKVVFPAASTIGETVFSRCSLMNEADLPLAASIGDNAFYRCEALTKLILRSSTVCTLSKTNALSSTPIETGTGYIYVPATLVDNYKAATNWSKYANQIRAIEDYPEVCDPYTWEGVFAAIDKGIYKDVYKVGDLVPLDLGSEGIIDMQIVAFDSDDKSDGSGKAAISWIGKQVLATKVEMNPALVSNDDGTYQEGTGTIGGWEKSTMRLHLQNTIMPIVPTLLLNNIKEVVKEHLAYDESGAKYTQTTNEKIWIPAQQEIDVTYGDDYKEIQPKYADLMSDNVFAKKGYNWGMRNALNKGQWRGASQNTGNIYNLYSGESVGIALGFCT